MLYTYTTKAHVFKRADIQQPVKLHEQNVNEHSVNIHVQLYEEK